MADAAKELPDTQFIIAGTGPTDIEGENIQRVGFVTGRLLQTLIRDAQFVVSPSVCTETFGLSNGEAIKLGTPVIATNLGAFPEIVYDGKNGILIEPGNIDSLKNSIGNLWNNKKLLTALKAGCNETQLLNVEEYTKKIMGTYSTVGKVV